MFLSVWREFPSAPCLARKRTWCQLASRCCWNRARPWHASELVPFLFGLRTSQPVNTPNNLTPAILPTHTHLWTSKSQIGPKRRHIQLRLQAGNRRKRQAQTAPSPSTRKTLCSAGQRYVFRLINDGRCVAPRVIERNCLTKLWSGQTKFRVSFGLCL